MHASSFAFAAWSALAPGVALAAMPGYDVDAHCREVAAFGGALSQTVLGACHHHERAAHDALRPHWDALPAALRQRCDEIARFVGGGSFTMLEACVHQELDAARR